jgi:class 3 adenylate cyclase/tetratricopeptide (TPR) repeat protein
MAQKNALGALAAFLPKLVLEQVARRAGAPPTPSVDSFEGVLLWADVSGFTPLVERLSRDGSAGAERLSEALGAHFGRLIELAEGAGGDLLFLAGDGALALWRAPPGEALAATLARATEAARTIIGELDGSRPQQDVTIRLRVALAAGPLDAFSVGGVDGRWLDLVAGKPLRELAAGVGPGQIAVAPSPRPAARAAAADEPAWSGLSPAASPPPGLEARALLPHVVPSLASRLEAGQQDFLAEFRAMTVVFADLSGLGQKPPLPLLQEAAEVVQAAAADFGGTVYQLIQDDKGTSAVAVFGLPGCSHEDDPVRAVRFAHRLAERLPPLIGGVSQGISTGPLFSGPCGLPRRCQYALFGRPMNRAARLMTAARGSILLDEETHRAASRHLELGPSRRLALKGLDEPLTAYAGDLGKPRPRPQAGLLGRQRERDLLLGRVTELMQDGAGGVVVVQGPPGIGKTSLLADLRRACGERRCPLASGSADFVEGRTPFFALRSILREFLGLASVSVPEDVEARALDALRTLGENAELLPLLGQALGQPIAENALMRQMTPAVRAENRSRLVLALVALAARRARWVAVIDDLHWSDAATAALLPQLAEIPGILWVLAGRPDDSPAGLLGKLAARGSAVALGGLPAADVAALAAGTLGAQAIPPALTALLVERAEGNPLYSRELALALRETGRIVVEDGRCALAPAFRPEAARDLPSSLYALIKSRIDRLPPGPQLTLRVASVIGQSFERRLLSEVATTSAAQLADNLGELAREGFLREETGAEARFAFGHATVQAVAYELFPERQRAHLHQVTALALERMYGPASPPVYGRLSHHWNEAGEAAKATEYSALAARQALDGYANRDAIELGRRALRNQEAWRGPRPNDVERANIYAVLAQAHYGLTEPHEARAAFEEALRHAGFADPGGGRGVLAGIARHLAGRALGRGRARASAREDELAGEARERVQAALGILAEWITLDFWEGRLLEGAAKAFLGHRLSAGILSSPLAAEAVARLGYTLAVTPFRFLAEGELLRGVELAVRSEDRQAMASSRVLLGMFYTLSGRSAEALRPLEEAQPPAEQLGAGLWRHRARFMLGETLLCLGRSEEARAAFARAAELSIGAEPPVAGMSTSMSALAVARLGRPDEALALLEGPRGLPLISGSFLPLQRFASLGAKAEVLLQLGRLDEARAVALEAAALAARGQDCDVFFAGLHGHAAVAEVALEIWERARAGAPAGGGGAELAPLRSDAERACARFLRFARMYPAARPRADALRGRTLALAGRTAAALRVLERARAAAEEMGLPHESALAGRLLAGVAAQAGRVRPAGSRP